MYIVIYVLKGTFMCIISFALQWNSNRKYELYYILTNEKFKLRIQVI